MCHKYVFTLQVLWCSQASSKQHFSKRVDWIPEETRTENGKIKWPIFHDPRAVSPFADERGERAPMGHKTVLGIHHLHVTHTFLKVFSNISFRCKLKLHMSTSSWTNLKLPHILTLSPKRHALITQLTVNCKSFSFFKIQQKKLPQWDGDLLLTHSRIILKYNVLNIYYWSGAFWHFTS